MKPCFVDTSAWMATLSRKDPDHQRCADFYRKCVEDGRPLVTSNLVIGELYTLMVYSFGPESIETFWEFMRRIEAERLIEVRYITPELDRQAYAILKAYDDQTFSYVDATSFALMRSLRLREAFTLDRDFEIAGFSRLPL